MDIQEKVFTFIHVSTPGIKYQIADDDRTLVEMKTFGAFCILYRTTTQW